MLLQVRRVPSLLSAKLKKDHIVLSVYRSLEIVFDRSVCELEYIIQKRFKELIGIANPFILIYLFV